MRRAIFTLCLALAFTIALSAGIRTQADPPESITIVFTWPKGQIGTVHGTFETSGAVVDSGTAAMDVRRASHTAHCVTTLTGANGTIDIHSQCSLKSNLGNWGVVSGTGAYSDLKANGGLIMDFSPPAYYTETFTGKAH